MPSEDAYTIASDRCPHPERWTADTRGSTENEVIEFLAAIVRMMQPDIVVETGTLLANSTIALGASLLRNDQRGHLYTLDINPVYVEAARQRVIGLPVTCVEADSIAWEPPGPIDLLFSDSELALRKMEILHYKRWMHERTLVIVHDTGNHHEYRLDHDLRMLQVEGVLSQLLFLPTPRGVALARVRIP